MKTLKRVAFVAGALLALSFSLTLAGCGKDKTEKKTENKFGDYKPVSVSLTGATTKFTIKYGADDENKTLMSTFLKALLTEPVYTAAGIEAKLENLKNFNLSDNSTFSFNNDGKFEATVGSVKVTGSYEVKDKTVTVKLAEMPELKGMKAVYALVLAKDMTMTIDGDKLSYDVDSPAQALDGLIDLFTMGMPAEAVKQLKNAFKSKAEALKNAKLHNELVKK